MILPTPLLDPILAIAKEAGPDNVGRINARFIRDGHSPEDWRAAIKEGERLGRLQMDPRGSGAFFTLP